MSELLVDPRHVRGDLQKVAAAVKQGWQIPDAIYEKAAVVIGHILQKGNNREKVAAMRCLIAMNQQNNPQPVAVAQHHHQHVHVEAKPEMTVEQRRRQLSQRLARLR